MVPMGHTVAPAHLVNAVLHTAALDLAEMAMHCYDAGGLRHVVRSLAEFVARVVRDAGDTETTAPQAENPVWQAWQWNRL
jgi:hypothetical protein